MHSPDNPELYWESGDTPRLQINSPFTAESLQDKALIASTYIDRELAVLPDAHMILIGGASIMDRGQPVLGPLLNEIVEARRSHKFILGVGGGARERHTYALGVDLGLPCGALSSLAWMVCEQNIIMLFHALAQYNAIEVPYKHFEMLSVYLNEGAIPIILSMPHYRLWSPLPKIGRIPMHRADTGAHLFSEVMGTKSCILIKDVDGLYTDNPKDNPKAEFIEEITVDELWGLDLPDLPVERTMLETLKLARNCREVRIVNGTKPGLLSQALNGESVGTLIRQ